MLDKNRIELLNIFLNEAGLTCDDMTLLDTALIHSSYPFENKLPSIISNERMEFLGDAVLKTIASEYLYKRFPEYAEGDLTKIRSILVSDNSLTKIARNINLGKYLKLGFHEEKMGGRERASNLACAFEAVLGALYLDGKINQLKPFLVNLIENVVTEIDTSEAKSNYKALIQEYCQSKGMDLPEYIIKSEDGPAHDKTFTIEIFINGKVEGQGTGKSKKEAQQKAAENAANALNIISKENQNG